VKVWSDHPIHCRAGHELPNPTCLFAVYSPTLGYVVCEQCRPSVCVAIDLPPSAAHPSPTRR
jgi:hypothetical protein